MEINTCTTNYATRLIFRSDNKRLTLTHHGCILSKLSNANCRNECKSIPSNIDTNQKIRLLLPVQTQNTLRNDVTFVQWNNSSMVSHGEIGIMFQFSVIGFFSDVLHNLLLHSMLTNSAVLRQHEIYLSSVLRYKPAAELLVIARLLLLSFLWSTSPLCHHFVRWLYYLVDIPLSISSWLKIKGSALKLHVESL